MHHLHIWCDKERGELTVHRAYVVLHIVGVCVCVRFPIRLSEKNRLASDQKRLVAEVRDKLQEYHDWNIKYNVSRFNYIRTYIHSICGCGAYGNQKRERKRVITENCLPLAACFHGHPRSRAWHPHSAHAAETTQPRSDSHTIVT